MTENLLLTVEEAGEALGIGHSRLYELLSSGAILSIKVGSKSRRIPMQALRDYVARLVAEQSEAA